MNINYYCMKQISWLLISLYLPLVLHAQNENSYRGIEFKEGLNWEQIKAKAQFEKKFIFVDVFASWCLPCKEMEKKVYPLSEVGNFFNKHFLSIKIQQDKTFIDSDTIYNKIGNAQKLIKEFNVLAYPTFLFFNSNGELLHRASGGYSSDKFINLGKEALDEKRGLVAKISAFKNGNFEGINLKDLAINVKYAGEDSLAKEIASIYLSNLDTKEMLSDEIRWFQMIVGGLDKTWRMRVNEPFINRLSLKERANPEIVQFILFNAMHEGVAQQATREYLNSLTKEQLFSKKTIEFMEKVVTSSSDKAFQILINNPNKVDKVTRKKGFAQDALDRVIIKEEFYDPLFRPAIKLIKNRKSAENIFEPDWPKLYSTIARKYDIKCAKRLKYSPKISWYKLVGDKKKYIYNLLMEMDRTKGFALNGVVLNNNCMEVFRYSTNKNELMKAASYMKLYFSKNPDEFEKDAAGIDTYAILLYKAEKIDEAIKLEEKACRINPTDSDISENLNRMKKGLPIWSAGFGVVN